MPLSEFPAEKQSAIAAAVVLDRPPRRWIDLELAQIESRAWYEWHWARGKRLRWVGAEPTRRRKIPDAIRFSVYERDGYACLHCGTPERLSLDHIHPFSLGGEDTIDNLQTLCRSCNSRKGARV